MQVTLIIGLCSARRISARALRLTWRLCCATCLSAGGSVGYLSAFGTFLPCITFIAAMTTAAAWVATTLA